MVTISVSTFRVISNMWFWYFVLGFLVLPGPSCSKTDNLALLLDTLKVVDHVVCNDEMVSLACPKGTTISIQVAQYGTVTGAEGCDVRVDTEADSKCKRPNAVQYSLLQTVVEACQKKPQCRFSTVPMEGLVDPCASQSKYVEVSYKCRPYEFRSRTGCEGEVIKLSCNPHSRISIFDAQYGRMAYDPDHSVSCFPAQGVPDETCSTPHAVKTAINLCLGRRRCQIAATNRTFNSSCRPESRPYLKVIYACVPLGVLAKKYESPAERDEISSIFNQEENLFDDSEDSGEKWGEPNAGHAVQPPFMQNTEPPEVTTTSPVNEDANMRRVKPNQEENADTYHGKSLLIVYFSVGILTFIILIGILIGVRYYISRRSDRSKNGDMYTTEPPNVFNDAFSDIDLENDASISHLSGTFHDPIHPDMILYKTIPGNRGAIRAMKPLCTIYPTTVEPNMYGVDYVPPQTTRFSRSRSNEEGVDPNVMTSPRSLGAHSSSHYYYG